MDLRAAHRRPDAGRARDELAELVAIRSVADPRQFPAEECERAARWVLEKFAELGFTDARLEETADGSSAVVGSRPGRDAGRADRAALRPLRRPAARWTTTPGALRRSSSPRSTAAGTAAAPPTARATSSCT